MSHVVQRSGDLARYTPRERVNHWFTVILFVLLAASGLAFFHPAFWFLSSLLGGGPWARILHPFLGVLMFLSFGAAALRYWGDNRIEAHDREWMKHVGDFLNNREARLPEIGKYNAGQKYAFWSTVICMLLLIVSGVVLWRPYFADFFPIPLIRIAAVVHMLSAFVLIVTIIVHAYAAFWIKGSVRAMTRGTVSHGWARHHHPLWYRKMTGTAK
jgi:formate dehydrogenase subunit gamma